MKQSVGNCKKCGCETYFSDIYFCAEEKHFKSRRSDGLMRTVTETTTWEGVETYSGYLCEECALQMLRDDVDRGIAGSRETVKASCAIFVVFFIVTAVLLLLALWEIIAFGWGIVLGILLLIATATTVFTTLSDKKFDKKALAEIRELQEQKSGSPARRKKTKEVISGLLARIHREEGLPEGKNMAMSKQRYAHIRENSGKSHW